MNKFKFRNKHEIEQEMKKKFKKTTITTIITCLVILIAYFVIAGMNIENINSVIIGGVALFVFMLLPTIVITMVYLYSSWISKTKLMFHEICITEQAIFIDQNKYEFSDIRQIRMTPPSYKTEIYGKNAIHRMMRIIDKHGNSITYFMGFRYPENLMFENYEEICTILKKTFKKNPEKFVFDL